MSAKTDSNGGIAAYRGFDYQKDVTVWIALEALLARGIAGEIIVEPASGEDIEVPLTEAVERALTTIHVPGAATLTIQVKHRGTGAWSANDFAALVNPREASASRGPAPRERAVEHLLTFPDRRYVLITNAGVEAALAGARISSFDEAPPPRFIPPHVSKGAQRHKLQGRFGILETQTREVTRAAIRDLLQRVGHVPSSRVEPLIDSLRRAVEDRMAGLREPLAREHLIRLIEQGGGLPVQDPELAEYVTTAVSDEAERILGDRNAILLLGPPGFGKSVTARWLVDRLRRADPPFELVVPESGTGVVQAALSAPGRHVVYLDDPWGQSRPAPDASDWSVQLPGLIARASPDKRFVVTSRADMFRLALGGKHESAWNRVAYRVDPATFDEGLRWTILQRKLGAPEGWRQDFVRRHREEILRELPSPLEIDRFAKALGECADAVGGDLRRLIDGAHQDSIRRVVQEQVKGWPRDGVRSAVVVWALLRASRRTVDVEMLRRIQRRMEEDAPQFVADAEAFVDHLGDHTLVPVGKGLRAAHPTVVAALEDVVTSHRLEARQTLTALVRALDGLRETDPGYEPVLLGIADAIKSVEAQGIDLTPTAWRPIDVALEERFDAAQGPDAAQRIHDLVYRGSNESRAARIAKYLEHGHLRPGRDERSSFAWQPAELDPAEVRALSADPLVARVVQLWVAHVLPFASEYYDYVKLETWLRPFAVDLDAAFSTAFESVTEELRYHMNADTVVEGVLAGPRRSYETVFARIEELERQFLESDLWERGAGRLWEAELDYAEQLFLQERIEEEDGAVGNALKGYLRARRRREGFGWIPGHPSLGGRLAPAWSEVMEHDPQGVTAEELEAFLTVADTPRLRAAGIRIIGQQEIRSAEALIHQVLRDGTTEERRAGVVALGNLVPAEERFAAVVAAMKDVDLGSQVDLFLVASSLAFPLEAKAAVMRRLIDAAPAGSGNALELFRLAQGSDVPTDEMVAIFEQLPVATVEELLRGASRKAARLLLRLCGVARRDVVDVANSWLASDEAEDVGYALEALDQLKPPDLKESFTKAAEHPSYRVRAYVVKRLARLVRAAERDIVLARGDDRSAVVRKAVAEVIGERRWEEGIPVLLRLLSDSRNFAPHPEMDQGPKFDFAVAKAAADALGQFQTLQEDVIDRIVTFVESGNAASRDLELHHRLVLLLGAARRSTLIPMFVRLLSDDRAEDCVGETLHPVRYAAAWALAVYHPYEVLGDANARAAMLRAARHEDPQLAAPGLMLAGLALDPAAADVLDTLRALTATPLRVALALLALDSREGARAIGLRHALLPADHPLIADVEGNQQGLPDTEDRRWPVTASMEAWLQSLDPERDVEGAVLRLAAMRTGLELGGDFQVTAIRRKRPEIPFTTVPEMFGWE